MSTEHSIWIIGQGEYDDALVKGVFFGTVDEAEKVVDDLEQSRIRVDEIDGTITHEGDAYWSAPTAAIRTAADVIGAPQDAPETRVVSAAFAIGDKVIVKWTPVLEEDGVITEVNEPGPGIAPYVVDIDGVEYDVNADDLEPRS